METISFNTGSGKLFLSSGEEFTIGVVKKFIFKTFELTSKGLIWRKRVNDQTKVKTILLKRNVSTPLFIATNNITSLCHFNPYRFSLCYHINEQPGTSADDVSSMSVKAPASKVEMDLGAILDGKNVEYQTLIQSTTDKAVQKALGKMKKL